MVYHWPPRRSFRGRPQADFLGVHAARAQRGFSPDRVLRCFFDNAPKRLRPSAIVIEHTHDDSGMAQRLMHDLGYVLVADTRRNLLLRFDHLDSLTYHCTHPYSTCKPRPNAASCNPHTEPLTAICPPNILSLLITDCCVSRLPVHQPHPPNGHGRQLISGTYSPSPLSTIPSLLSVTSIRRMSV